MKLNFKGVLAATAIAAQAAFGWASAAQAADYTIKVAFLGSQDDEDYDGAMVFKNYVESVSNGAVEVQIYPSGQFCGNEKECLENLQAGILEVFITTIGGFGNVFGPGQVLDLPYMFKDDRTAECVFDGPFTDQLRDGVLQAGIPMRLMVVSNTGGWRNFATTTKLIKRPEDIKGMKIRTIAAEIQQELVRQLGGNPTPVAWPEVYTALATGVVEGTKNGITDIMNMKFPEAGLKYLTLDGHAYMGALWWYSDVAWQQLPDDIKRIVFDGMNHLKTVTRAMPMRRQIEAYEAFKAQGGQIYVPNAEEKAAFQQATSGMRQWYIDKYGEEWLNKLDAAVAECTQKIDAEFAAAAK
ncbi:tripartite ATP-independent transporter DctP family solute receptor [Albidovulum inexpectatum]|uniref:Tripartite ATP-independent transporter DctP family solute receptor n=1 Tax=Albidovulum inexpectatum TaxID=196587 RepID=A0A2S5JHU1_9RHOB|nr:TRAP transporter substrate-binding protein DctP [Albidovulum inexpectatum]PPB80928.1 tripartite ATP-independent transporter DctP family solute receptor [Albidovulum inexpectatum]